MVLVPPLLAAHPVAFLEIAAGRKSAISRTAKHHATELIVIRLLAKEGEEFADHQRIYSVQCVRSIESDYTDARIAPRPIQIQSIHYLTPEYRCPGPRRRGAPS